MDRGRINNKHDSLWGVSARDNPVISQVPLQYRIRGPLTQEQQTGYQFMFRIQEITMKLRTNDLNPIRSRNRSISPPPVYDSQGKRTNTREHRYRKKLEEERHRLVEIALKMIPHFVAPDDYRRPSKFQDKYYIPINDYPGINFVGLLLGPRGNTLKQLQQKSGCKIAIRGRGSLKEGKTATDLPKGAMNMNEPLHCIISADTEERIPLGINAVESIIVKAITSPEGQNDLKRGQLRELAVLNGTLREDNRPCPVCGQQGHKKWECPSSPSLSLSVICLNCNKPGHAARDCTYDINEFGKRSNHNAGHGDVKRPHADSSQTVKDISQENSSSPILVAPGTFSLKSAALKPPDGIPTAPGTTDSLFIALPFNQLSMPPPPPPSDLTVLKTSNVATSIPPPPPNISASSTESIKPIEAIPNNSKALDGENLPAIPPPPESL